MHRARIASTELQQHEGKWVALSADGRCILDSGESIAELCSRFRAAGQDSQDVVLERIEFDAEDVYLGGAELR
jgi:alkanesulfonate monooxygenase SsuD/methylene tetrahydromethanopterin reductase-like flavin-dependent oxidoreductase (luciferase family)